MRALQSRSLSTIQKIISIVFLLIFTTIIVTVICFNWIPYCGQKELLFPNIVSLTIALVASIICYILLKNISISKKTYYATIISVFIILFLLQLFVLYFSYFKTGWDAGTVNLLADQASEEGAFTTAGSSAYVAMYPNNVLIITILTILKNLPIISEKYFTIIIFNAILVNLASLTTCLVVKKLVSRRASLMTIFIVVPLILFSPWTIIPYSDTFAILTPILVLYIYVTVEKWWKYAPIVLLSVLGYYVKPTVIFMLVAIIIVELFKCRWRKPSFNKDFWLRFLSIFNGLLLALLVKYASFSYINYHPDPTIVPASVIHYLAMGQNEENCGRYLEEDYRDMGKGKKFELQKFCNRITSRSLGDQINFFAKKLLTNFDDGTFAWGGEGSFYKTVPERNNPVSNFLASIYYNDMGQNYKYFAQLEQMVWVFVLFGCIFIFKRTPTVFESALEIALIGIVLFVMMFEARARYIYCYTPLFITCSIIGYSHLRNLLANKPHKVTLTCINKRKKQ